MDAVAVSGGEDSNFRTPLGDESCVVADAISRGHVANVDDAGAQTHHGSERKLLFGFRAALDGIVAGMIAIENCARANHIGPGLRAGSDGGAVGKVNESGINA